MSYTWREGSRFHGDPDKVGNRLEWLREKYGDEALDADLVVADAKKPSSPFHVHFDWNVQRAAEENWRAVARTLMGSVVKVQIGADGIERTVRAFIAIPIEGRTGQVYTPFEIVLRDPDKRAALLRQALADANTWRRKYETLEELTGVFTALEEAANGVHA